MKRLLIGVTVVALCAASTSFAGLFTRNAAEPGKKFVAVTVQDSHGHRHQVMLLQKDAENLRAGEQLTLVRVPAFPAAKAPMPAR